MSSRKQKINVHISRPNDVAEQELYQEILTDFYTEAIITMLDKYVPYSKRTQATVLTKICKYIKG